MRAELADLKWANDVLVREVEKRTVSLATRSRANQTPAPAPTPEPTPAPAPPVVAETVPVAPAAPQASSEGTPYTVKRGDSLSTIARDFYGNIRRWREIYDANRARIANPDVIAPGTELVIPPR